ncbi:MAG: TerB family tellurite resistance protein [Hyphomicrobium sp.]
MRGSLRRLLDRLGLLRFWRRRFRAPGESAAFTSAFVALAAKMAKADGVAVAAEWDAFERLLEVPEAERANVRRLYDLAKGDASGADVYATRLERLLAPHPTLRRDVIECLLYVACSDGVLHPAEDAFLAEAAGTLGISAAEFHTIRARFVSDPTSPYEVLGLAPNVSDAEIKTRYRRLVAESHPDRLMAAGAPAAVVKAATTKMAAINAAHEAIVKERRRGGVQ